MIALGMINIDKVKEATALMTRANLQRGLTVPLDGDFL